MEQFGNYGIALNSWLEARSRWNLLKALGDSNLVKASVLMPAFGYILLLNDNVHQYLTIKYDGWLLDYLPSTWRIWLLFYGSFFLAIAAILYSWQCPSEIKRYVSSFEMSDAESEHQLRMKQFDHVRETVRSLYKSLSEFERSILGSREPEYDVGGHLASEKMSEFLVHQWTVRNIQSARLRIFILLLFSAGLALIAIPAIFTFVQVTGLLLKRMFS